MLSGEPDGRSCTGLKWPTCPRRVWLLTMTPCSAEDWSGGKPAALDHVLDADRLVVDRGDDELADVADPALLLRAQNIVRPGERACWSTMSTCWRSSSVRRRVTFRPANRSQPFEVSRPSAFSDGCSACGFLAGGDL